MKFRAVMLLILAIMLFVTGCAGNHSGVSSAEKATSTVPSSNQGEDKNIDSKKPAPFTSFVFSGSNDKAGITADAPTNPSGTIVKSGMAKKTITFLGNEYTLTYSLTKADYTSYGRKDKYVTTDGYSVELNEETGELNSIVFLTGKNFYENEAQKPESDKPRDNAVAIAEEVAGKYIDVGGYECKVSENTHGDGVTYYTIVFTKFINGTRTTDYVSVKVNSKGTLCALYLGELGAFDTLDLSEAVKEKISYSVEDKLNKAYSLSEYSLTEYGVTGQKLVLTNDGQMCVYTLVKVSSQKGENTLDSAIALITYL